jgi:hypothetical protein
MPKKPVTATTKSRNAAAKKKLIKPQPQPQPQHEQDSDSDSESKDLVIESENGTDLPYNLVYVRHQEC